MLLCIVEDAKRTGGLLQHNGAFWIEEHIWKRSASWWHSERLADFYFTVPDRCRATKSRWLGTVQTFTNWPMSLSKPRTDPVFWMRHSGWECDNEWRVPSDYDVFCSSLILITICSSFAFVFVRGSRWIFSAAAVRDVKRMNSIKSLYLYFILWEETKRKALEIIVVVEDRRYSVFYFVEEICCKISLREGVERDYGELSSSCPSQMSGR